MNKGLDALQSNAIKLHVKAHIDALLKNANAIPFQCSRDWANQFTYEAGIYSVFDKKKLIYVGESGSLKGRMRDLLDTRNHTLRRRLGSELFNTRDDYFPANTKHKFPEAIVSTCLRTLVS